MSVLRKVMESFTEDSLEAFLERKGTITGCQHGFREGRSCLTNLRESLESWTQVLDSDYDIDILYLDCRKAFDSVLHKRLLKNEEVENLWSA